MSEYAHSSKEQPARQDDDALFDDATFDKIDHLVDTLGISYDEAQRRVTGSRAVMPVIQAPYKAPRTPETASRIDAPHGAAVDLAARALALEHVMAAYNQLNKTNGAYEGGRDAIDARYNHPDEVRDNMGRKAQHMVEATQADINVLNATDEMLAAGFDPATVLRQKDHLRSDLLDDYGPGRAYAPKRNKLVRKVQKTAKRAAKGRS